MSEPFSHWFSNSRGIPIGMFWVDHLRYPLYKGRRPLCHCSSGIGRCSKTNSGKYEGTATTNTTLHILTQQAKGRHSHKSRFLERDVLPYFKKFGSNWHSCKSQESFFFWIPIIMAIPTFGSKFGSIACTSMSPCPWHSSLVNTLHSLLGPSSLVYNVP